MGMWGFGVINLFTFATHILELTKANIRQILSQQGTCFAAPTSWKGLAQLRQKFQPPTFEGTSKFSCCRTKLLFVVKIDALLLHVHQWADHLG